MCVKNIFHWEKAACSNTGYNGQGSEFVKHTEVCGYTALLSLKGTVVYKRKIFVLAVSTNIWTEFWVKPYVLHFIFWVKNLPMHHSSGYFH